MRFLSISEKHIALAANLEFRDLHHSTCGTVLIVYSPLQLTFCRGLFVMLSMLLFFKIFITKQGKRTRTQNPSKYIR